MPKRPKDATPPPNQPTLEAFFVPQQRDRPSPRPPLSVSESASLGLIPRPTAPAAPAGGYKIGSGSQQPPPQRQSTFGVVQRQVSSGASLPVPPVAPSLEMPSTTQRTAGGRVVCTYFVKGTCRDGTACRYAHEQPAPRRQPSRPAPALPSGSGGSAAKAPCTYYHSPTGNCTSGSACRHGHYDDWRHDAVRMPWSPANTARNPATRAEFSMWARASAVLDPVAFPVASTGDLEELLVSVLPPDASKLNICDDFESLLHVIDHEISDEERKRFFHVTLPWMRTTALAAPKLLAAVDGGHLRLLRQNVTDTVELTTTQVAALMCCAFFSLFPERHRFTDRRFHGSEAHQKYAGKLPNFNLSYLFGMGGPSVRGKIRCLIAYFDARAAMPATAEPEYISVTRVTEPAPVDLTKCERPLTAGVEVRDAGVIEDCTEGALEVDFANKSLGGGVIGRGCVQEEIRFAIAPELFVARLLCEQLHNTDAVFICGARQYAKYTGYSDTFAFAGPAPPPAKPAIASPANPNRKFRQVAVVAMDATNYNGHRMEPGYQYIPAWVERDTVKAYIAFKGAQGAPLQSVASGPIATGNWGCGAFGGDLEFKFLQQLVAASAVGRPLTYFTFGKPEFAAAARQVYASAKEAGMRTCDLYLSLITYHGERHTAVPQEDDEAAAAAAAPDPALIGLSKHSTLDYVEGLDASPITVPDVDVPEVPPPPSVMSPFQHIERELRGEL